MKAKKLTPTLTWVATCCVALSKLLGLSGSQVSHVHNRGLGREAPIPFSPETQ